MSQINTILVASVCSFLTIEQDLWLSFICKISLISISEWNPCVPWYIAVYKAGNQMNWTQYWAVHTSVFADNIDSHSATEYLYLETAKFEAWLSVLLIMYI